MFTKIKEFFFGKPVEKTVEAPYKIEAPKVEEVASPVSEAATQAMVESVAPAKKSSGKKAPAPKKQGAPKQGGKTRGRKPKSKSQE